METADEGSASSKAERVRAMFDQIAPRYDLLNHTLSLNVDKRWRRFVVEKVSNHLQKPDAVALDLCCGTADLSLELARLSSVVGMDFCHPMLQIGLRKVTEADRNVSLVEADALRVPAPDERFDVVTIAFGLRNLEDVRAGLGEMFRLLKPGGRGAVLEFSKPVVPVFRSLFRFYFNNILPAIGNKISGSGFAYKYLPESVKEFPDQKGLSDLMASVGFCDVNYYNLSAGIAALHTGDKPSAILSSHSNDLD